MVECDVGMSNWYKCINDQHINDASHKLFVMHTEIEAATVNKSICAIRVHFLVFFSLIASLVY